MYKYQDRNTKPLFQELFSFGGKLDKENRRLKVAEVIPWKELEGVYAARHAKRGRPSTRNGERGLCRLSENTSL